jgi:hypothetical protein
MKLKIWIGPLLAVIFVALLRQMMYNSMQNEQQRSDIPAAIEKKPEFNPPMAGTRLLTDTLPF